MTKCAASISHVVNKDGNFVAYITNKHHWRHFICLLALLVDQGKVYIQLISDRRHPDSKQPTDSTQNNDDNE